MPSEETLLAQREHEHVVVTLPDEIDVTNSLRVREALLAAISRQPATVIADMTATTFCDCSCTTAILTAHWQAAAAGTNLRLAISHLSPRRVFELTGADAIVSTYPSLPAALAG